MMQRPPVFSPNHRKDTGGFGVVSKHRAAGVLGLRVSCQERLQVGFQMRLLIGPRTCDSSLMPADGVLIEGFAFRRFWLFFIVLPKIVVLKTLHVVIGPVAQHRFVHTFANVVNDEVDVQDVAGNDAIIERMRARGKVDCQRQRFRQQPLACQCFCAANFPAGIHHRKDE